MEEPTSEAPASSTAGLSGGVSGSPPHPPSDSVPESLQGRQIVLLHGLPHGFTAAAHAPEHEEAAGQRVRSGPGAGLSSGVSMELYRCDPGCHGTELDVV